MTDTSAGDDEQLESMLGFSKNYQDSHTAITKGAEALQCIGVIHCEKSLGTGFLLPGNFLLTSNHVLPSKEVASNASVSFEFVRDKSRHTSNRPFVRLQPKLGFYKSSEVSGLDFTLVRVEGDQNSELGFLELEPDGVSVEEKVRIVGHYNGLPQQASHEERVIDVAENHLKYLVDTERGGSGSPVFNLNWNVVGIHQKGNAVHVDETGRVKCNQGVNIAAVISALKTQGAWPLERAGRDISVCSTVSDESASKTDLFEYLSRLGDKKLCSTVLAICDQVIEDTTSVKEVAKTNFLDPMHGYRVAQAMWQVLDQEVRQTLSKSEIVALLLAAYLHDYSLVDDYRRIKEIKGTDAFALHRERWVRGYPNYNRAARAADTTTVDELNTVCEFDFLRSRHETDPVRSINLFFQDGDWEPIPVPLEALILSLVKAHHMPIAEVISTDQLLKPRQVQGEHVNVAFLISVLRAADSMAFSPDKLLLDVFSHTRRNGRVSVAGWFQQHLPTNATCDLVNANLVLSMQCEQPEYYRSAKAFASHLDQEISNVHRLLDASSDSADRPRSLAVGIGAVDVENVRPKRDCFVPVDLEFHLDRHAMTKLFLTKGLYQDNSLCVRELVQNSTDACRLASQIRQRRTNDTKWTPTIKLEHAYDDDGREYFRCSDNGTGMDQHIIENFLTRIGRSYFQSDEFNQSYGAYDSFSPIARFGIGFASCFMLGESIEIETTHINEKFDLGESLRVEILGIDGLMAIRKTALKDPGTTVTIWIDSEQDASHDFDLMEVVQQFCLHIPIRIEVNVNLGDYRVRKTFDANNKLAIPSVPELDSSYLYSSVSQISPKYEGIHGWVRTFAGINRHATRDASVFSRPYWAQKFFSYFFGVPLFDSPIHINGHAGQISVTRDLEPEEQPTVDGYRKRWTDPYILQNKVMFDGVLVTSTEVHEHGHHGAFHHRFISDEMQVNVTGPARPQLTPARTPPADIDEEPTWSILRRAIREAAASNWIKIAQHKKISWWDYWQLVGNYDANVAYCDTEAARTILAFPFGGKYGPYRSLKSLERLFLDFDSFDQFLGLSNGKGGPLHRSISSPVLESRDASRSKNDKSFAWWQMNKVLVLHASLECVQDRLAFNYIDAEPSHSAFERVLPQGDGVLLGGDPRELWCIPFINDLSPFIAVDGSRYAQPQATLLNESHGLVKYRLTAQPRDNRQATALYRFAEAITRYIVGCICLVSGVPDDQVDHMNLIRQRIGGWYREAYDDLKDKNLLPPYRVWRSTGEVKLTHKVLKSWDTKPSRRVPLKTESRFS